jgi:hypothetical protein
MKAIHTISLLAAAASYNLLLLLLTVQQRPVVWRPHRVVTLGLHWQQCREAHVHAAHLQNSGSIGRRKSRHELQLCGRRLHRHSTASATCLHFVLRVPQLIAEAESSTFGFSV